MQRLECSRLSNSWTHCLGPSVLASLFGSNTSANRSKVDIAGPARQVKTLNSLCYFVSGASQYNSSLFRAGWPLYVICKIVYFVRPLPSSFGCAFWPGIGVWPRGGRYQVTHRSVVAYYSRIAKCQTRRIQTDSPYSMDTRNLSCWLHYPHATCFTR